MTEQTYEPDEGYPPDTVAGDNIPIPRASTIRKRAIAAKTPAPPPKKKKPVNQSKILAREKQRRALELRKGGATYDAIAQALGYADPSGARKAIERAIKKVIQEPALEVKTLQIERCNHMLLTLWPQVQTGDLGAINSAIRVMQQLDAYMGTTEAQQIDVNVHHEGGILVVDGNKEDFIAQMKRMVGIDRDGRNVPEIEQTPYVQGDVVDAVVIPDPSESLADSLTEDQKETMRTIMAPPQPDVQVSFDFGMDPEKYKK